MKPMAGKNRPLCVLGIETSCDETAAAVVYRHGPGEGRIAANVVASQVDQHAAYGGVVPEIAARAHVTCLDRLIGEAMAHAGVGFADLDGIAATAGPGLIGGLLVGLVSAKAIAMAHRLPLVGVNHLEGHVLTPGLTEGLLPPYLVLLVSGGHSQLIAVRGSGRYTRYGTTIDDALGEAFDKTAKLLGLGYPGGPQVERMAATGDAVRVALPRPLVGRPGYDFSFSGLKTAVRHAAAQMAPLDDRDIADICAGFQAAVCDVLADRCGRALERFAREFPAIDRHLVIAGGVAANRTIAARLEEVSHAHGARLVTPPGELCTDNAAMIAWAGAERLARGECDDLDFAARARWPLDVDAPPAPFAGVKA